MRTTYLPSSEELEARRKESPLLLNEVDKFAVARAGIRGLRETDLNEDRVELRIWVGFAPWITRGLILRPEGGIFLPPVEGRSPGDKPWGKPRSVTPREGWEPFWEELNKSGLFDLPDETVVGIVEPFDDSDGIIIEFKKGAKYRHFSYAAPCHSDTAEARKLLHILASIAEKLDIDYYRCAEESN